MILIGNRKPRTKPPLGAQIDRGHALAQGLEGCFLLNEGGGARAYNAVTGRPYAFNGSPAWSYRQGGLLLDSSGGNDRGVFDTAEPRLQQAKVLTVFWRGYVLGSPTGSAMIAGLTYASTDSSPWLSFCITWSGGFSYLQWNVNGSFSGGAGNSYTNYTGKLTNFTGVIDLVNNKVQLYSGTNPEFGADGAPGTGSISYSASASFGIGQYVPSAGRNSNTAAECSMVWSRRLSMSEIASLCDNPYQVVWTPRRRVWVSQGTITTQTLTGGGIISAETFGSGGSVTPLYPIAGSAGIGSGEAFGTGGSLYFGVLAGSAGIGSGEAFGVTGSLVAGLVSGAAGGGIVSAEAFGSGGSVSGPVAGAAGISSAETFGAGGALVYAQTLAGSAGIATAETFGSGGKISWTLTGTTGISSAEAFGSGGSLVAGVAGYLGIESAETFGAGGALVGARPQTLYIGGRDRTDYLMGAPRYPRVSMEINGPATAEIPLTLPAGARYRPRLGAELILYDGARRMFAGYVVETDEEPTWGASAQQGRLPAEVTVKCADYTDILDRRVVSRTWAGPTLDLVTITGEIVRDFLDGEQISYAADESITLTNQGKLELQGETARDALDRVAAVFGCDWRLDYHRVLHMERQVLQPAPRALGTYSDSWDTVTIKRSRRQKRNRQGIIGGAPGSGQRTKTFTELTGSQWDFEIGEAITNKPTVTLNGSSQTVVLSSETAAGPWDCSYTAGGSAIAFNRAQAGPTGTLEVTYPSRFALDITWHEDSADIERTRRLSGGSGIYEAVRRVKDAKTLEAAEQLARTAVEQKGSDIVELTFTSRVLGWEPGQLVTVDMANPRYAGALIIRRVEYQLVDKTLWEYTVTAASVDAPAILGVARQADGSTEIIVDRPVGDPTDWTAYGGFDGGGGVDYAVDNSILQKGRFKIIEVWFNGPRTVCYLVTGKPHGFVADMHVTVEGVSSPFHMINKTYVADVGTGTLAGTGHGNDLGTDLIVLKAAETPATTPGFGATAPQNFVVSGVAYSQDPPITNMAIVGTDLVITTEWEHYIQPDQHFAILAVPDPFSVTVGRRYVAGASTGGTEVYLNKAQCPRNTPGFFGTPSAAFVAGGFVTLDEYVDDGRTGNGGSLAFSPTIIAIRYLPDHRLVVTCDGPIGLQAGQPYEIRGVRSPYHGLDGSYDGPEEDSLGDTLIIPAASVPPGVPSDVSLFQPGGYVQHADVAIVNVESITFSGDDYMRIETAATSGVGESDPFRMYGIAEPYQALNGRTFKAHALSSGEFIYVAIAAVPSGVSFSETFVVSGYVHNTANDEDTKDPKDPRDPSGTQVDIANIEAQGSALLITTAEEHGVIAGDRFQVYDVVSPYAMCNLSYQTRTGSIVSATQILIPGDQADPTTPGLHGNPAAEFAAGGYLVNEAARSVEGGGGEDGGGVFGGLGPSGGDGGDTGGFGSGGGSGSTPLIPIAVEIDGSLVPEFTTNKDHGLITTTPTGGDEVMIAGCVGDPGHYNTGRSRIQVTGDRTFRALDNQVPAHEDRFVNDGKGRVYKLGTIPRPVGGGDDIHSWVVGLRGGGPDGSEVIDKATFVLAQTIPGLASMPLRVADDVTNPWIAQREQAVVVGVSATFKNPPVGGDVVLDIKRNGESIFPPGNQLVVPEGSTTTVFRESAFVETPLRVTRGDVFTMDVKQVGSTFPGCNGTVVVAMK